MHDFRAGVTFYFGRMQAIFPSLESTPSPLIAVLGPTGSGKSELALALAGQLKGEIVNFDSVQVCRGLDIGSAKLSPAERKNIPHHLIDVADPNVGLTAGAYATLGQDAAVEITRRGFVPIFVGGTGFYLRALLDGLSPAPPANPYLRTRLAELARRRPLALFRYLSRMDPATAERIHPNDHQKLIRAIELARQAEPVPPRLPRRSLPGFVFSKIGLDPDRSALRSRIDARVRRMFKSGLLEETKALIANGVSPRSKALQSIGYRQAVSVLEEGAGLEDAIRDCQTKTRQYAKRQMTWFRREEGVCWLQGFGEDPEIQKIALARCQEFVISHLTGS
jgi:tRNA dimethylallyltransferase